jgi:DNA-binding IclR family transcriptional regulator
MFRDEDTLRLSEVSKHLNVANSTAHRLLAMLAYHDLVHQIGTSRVYMPGKALIEVGLAVAREVDIRDIAHPYLLELCQRFSETAHLAALEGTFVRYLDSIESPHAVRIVSRAGSLTPAHCTSVGKALLAGLVPQQVDALYEHKAMTTLTDRSIRSIAQLRATLDVVRQQGYAQNDSESDDGVVSVAALIRDASGNGIAAISVAAPEQRFPKIRRVEVAHAVIDAANRIAEALPF